MPENNINNGSIRNRLREPLRRLRTLSSRAWGLVKSSAISCAILIMVVYALWEARTPVTMIAPFQITKTDLSLTGDIVADAVQDGLKSIRNEIDEERQDTGLKSSETGLPDFRNMLMPKFWRVQAPARFSVEVKGVSYERVLSVARGVLGTETTISGDVIVNGGKFILIARAADAGPWYSAPYPMTAEGLKQAGRDLALEILKTQDPTLAGMALLKHGKVDQGLEVLERARSLNPSDARYKLNLCMGLAASRRYERAIDCYQQAILMKPDSPLEIQERLAQAYYLKGLRNDAINLYEELCKEGYRNALLGLGEAEDDTGDPRLAMTVYDNFLATERQDRNKAIAHVKKGVALAHMGRHEDALNEYEEALKYAPRDVLILVHEGRERADVTDLDAGIAQLKSVVDENQDSDSLPFARLQLGALLEKKLDWRGAVDEYKKAAQMRPTYVEAHLKLAHALVQAGKQTEAFHEYSVVAELSASDLERGYSKILAHQWLANDLRNLSKYDDAAKQYGEAIGSKSDDSAAHCQLALIHARKGHLSKAVHEYGLALVPAKFEELNDRECLAVVDHVVDEAVASHQPGYALAAAELSKIRQGKRDVQSVITAQNTLPRPLAKSESTQQVALQTEPW